MPQQAATAKMLKTALPTMVPTPISPSVMNVPITFTNSSGADVAAAMNVAPATSLDIFSAVQTGTDMLSILNVQNKCLPTPPLYYSLLEKNKSHWQVCWWSLTVDNMWIHISRQSGDYGYLREYLWVEIVYILWQPVIECNCILRKWITHTLISAFVNSRVLLRKFEFYNLCTYWLRITKLTKIYKCQKQPR